MPTTHLKEMQQDLKEATSQLEMISEKLRSHATYLRGQKLDHSIVDILLIENQVEALTLSIEDLKGATQKISKAD